MVFMEQVTNMFRKMRFIIWSKTRRIKVQNHYHTFRNGCSMTAIKDGKVLIIRWVWSNERIDYGTRSGDVDQSVIFI
jgi:acetate kinase